MIEHKSKTIKIIIIKEQHAGGEGLLMHLITKIKLLTICHEMHSKRCSMRTSAISSNNLSFYISLSLEFCGHSVRAPVHLHVCMAFTAPVLFRATPSLVGYSTFTHFTSASLRILPFISHGALFTLHTHFLIN